MSGREESFATAVAQRFAEVLTAKGLCAYFGREWDGACDHKDPEFWYFHPTSGGGVGAYSGYDRTPDGGSTYDMTFLAAEDLDAALSRLEALQVGATRAEVSRALGGTE